MEWSKDDTIRLINLFREKSILWDSSNEHFKDRHKKHEAWAKLAAKMELGAYEVERKMRTLIGQFQRELKKGGNGDLDAPYKSKWSFFRVMLFLKDKDDTRYSIEPVDLPGRSFIRNHDGHSQNELHLNVLDGPENFQQKNVDKSIPRISQVQSLKRKVDAMPEETCSPIKQLSSSVIKRDEFDVFGEHVANTLRNLITRTIQSRTKFEICEVLYRAEMNEYSQQTSFTTPGPPTLSGRSSPNLPSNSSTCIDSKVGITGALPTFDR